VGEVRRKRLARMREKSEPIDWTDPAARAGIISLIHERLAADHDPTLTGCTLILPGSAPMYISAHTAKRGRKPGQDA
jgi:hypothetical protein